MALTWKQYYNKYYDGQGIREFLNEYKLYEQQESEPEITEDGYKLFGFNIMILQEDGYTLIQEGRNEYGYLQDFKEVAE